MTQSAVPNWQAEHGIDYQVPSVIAHAEGIVDRSWHNDTCPSFHVPLANKDHELVIWAEHPDADQREALEARFVIQFTDITGKAHPFGPESDVVDLWSGDDAEAVIPAYVELLRQYRRWERFSYAWTEVDRLLAARLGRQA